MAGVSLVREESQQMRWEGGLSVHPGLEFTFGALESKPLADMILNTQRPFQLFCDWTQEEANVHKGRKASEETNAGI